MWRDDMPIYKQLKDKVVNLILTNVYAEGDSLPSVRSVASEYQINHLTVGKAYQELVDEMIVEKRRGLGMFVLTGAQGRLLESEKNKFFNEEVPGIKTRLKQLNIEPKELFERLSQE